MIITTVEDKKKKNADISYMLNEEKKFDKEEYADVDDCDEEGADNNVDDFWHEKNNLDKTITD